MGLRCIFMIAAWNQQRKIIYILADYHLKYFSLYRVSGLGWAATSFVILMIKLYILLHIWIFYFINMSLCTTCVV